MISVVIDCNIIFFLIFIVWIILSMHAFIGYSFFGWNMQMSYVFYPKDRTATLNKP